MKQGTRPLALAAALGCWMTLGSAAAAQEYQVDLGQPRSVTFTSDAPLDDFQGITERVDGFLLLPEGWQEVGVDLAGSEFHFEVDLASLDTGIGLRNRHMRENYLETNEFPFASYSGTISRLAEEGPGRFGVTAVGVFAIHGINREQEVECHAEASDSDLMVRCAFQVTLSDHGIPIPKLMFMKIDEVMDLDLHFFLSPAQSGEGQ